MANFRAIGTTSAALAGLIRDSYPRADFGSGLDIALYQARDFDTPMQDGFSIFLYRVSVNASVRNRPPRRTPDGRRLRPSLPVDLNYLITPWAEDSGRQQRMLGWSMRFLEDQGVLSAAHLNHYVAETDTFAPSEGIEVVCDPLSLQDYLTIWDRLRPRLPPSATYSLRMLALDSEIEMGSDVLVQTRTFDMKEVVQ